VTIEELKGDLNRLQDDAVQVARDSQSLMRNFGKQRETVEDEFVAAELLATNNTIEGVGLLFDSAIRLGEIGRQQFKYCIDDGRKTFKNLRSANTGDEYVDALSLHMGRRVDHLAMGLESTWRMVGDEWNEISSSVDTSWKMFSRMVNTDWSRTTKENN